ncbi:branched-chain amino acid ABC transporter permease [Georgenia thermotolerans]|uniref:Branched-chain amino acid ABC transporter permease n=1 Tax=Georgenia thermotolerans TaxID=527326 RepID=A0A7J5UUW2_9MICO|nr:branched-chain amino acid ABC transporter permease [Georgenia thermotolerans]KAE8766089.1 branched-chain amino acid ABC transporter permease [Georgenia thermotolerans]
MTNVQALIDAISNGALYGLAALGIGLVFGVMRLANFAHGELITIAAYTLVLTWHLGPWVALPLALVASVVLALLLEFAVFRRMRRANPATLLIASFGLSFLLQRVYEIAFGNNVRTAPVAPALARSVEIGGMRVQMLSLVTILAAAILLLALHQFLNRSSLGLQVQAASADFATARLLGVRANKVIALTFGISGALAAVVAFVLTVQTGAVAPTFGVNITVLALIGAVIGGIDKLGTSLVGGFLVGFASSALTTYLPSEAVNFRNAFVFAVVMVILILKPSGLLVRGPVLERA